MCTVTCPKGLNPQARLMDLMTKVKEVKAKRQVEEVL